MYEVKAENSEEMGKWINAECVKRVYAFTAFFDRITGGKQIYKCHWVFCDNRLTTYGRLSSFPFFVTGEDEAKEKKLKDLKANIDS